MTEPPRPLQSRPLQLPSPARRPPRGRPRRAVPRKGPRTRWRQVGTGLLLGAAGAGLLLGLMQIPDRLDALLLVSNAIANLITGLSHLSIGVLQLAGVLMVVALALLALLLLVGGGVRIFRALSTPPAPPPGASPGSPGS